MIDNNLKLINELQKNFSKLLELNDNALNSLPKEHEELVVNIRKDINEITNSVKTGDLNKLNIIKERYANNSSV